MKIQDLHATLNSTSLHLALLKLQINLSR